MKTRTAGYLFDVHEGRDTVVLWVYRDDGALVRLEADFHPCFYVRADRPRLEAIGQELTGRGLISRFRRTEGIEFWSGKAIEVGEYAVGRYEYRRRVVDRLAAWLGESALYNADLPVPQYYLYTSGLFPLGRLEVEHAGDRVLAVRSVSPVWETEYPRPALRVLRLQFTQSRFRPLEKGNGLLLGHERARYEVTSSNRRRLLEAVNDLFARIDPDVILSEEGDERIFPQLLRAARQERMQLLLDRDAIPTERPAAQQGKSYMSYGRILYKPPSYLCFGRWHVDASSSFIVAETGLDGLVELSRLARLPPQKMARTTPGTAMNSIECYEAFRRRILIPYQKAEPEKYKTAWELLVSDKGGLAYMQPVGAFENVAEIDYASMYPTLMMQKNLSPETVRCACCQNVRVPEIGYNVCERREGLLPLALGPILARRRVYKQLKKNGPEALRKRYDDRQHALKWLLVTAFGFTGYRNARFGRIECHEATTAWGRELLLQAKEMAEAQGFQLLHALTDSLWIRKPAMTETGVLALCRQITQTTGVEMCLEGLYSWIVFLPSRENDERGVACRYFARLGRGEVKVRGLVDRRHDTPEFVREAQNRLLGLLAGAETLDQCQEKAGQAQLLLNGWVEELAGGRVAPARLLVTHRLSKELESYKVRTMTAEAAGQLRRAGIRLHPGEQIRYLVLSAGSRGRKGGRIRKEARAGQPEPARVLAEAFIEEATEYDVEYYKRLLYEAADEVLRFLKSHGRSNIL